MVRLPAEWETHERTLMGWPCRRQLWGPEISRARADYAAVANAIAAFEPVTMIANPGEDSRMARAACGQGVQIVELPLDDSWLRDCRPIYVYGEDGRRMAMHFHFNGWGEKFLPWDRDAAVGGRVAQEVGDQVVSVPLVLEGGLIICDGGRTLLTTEQCLLNPNRNPMLSREQIEEELRSHLGVSRIVWLRSGLLEDRDTDGHVDLIAAFAAPGEVLLQTVDPANANYECCEENRPRLLAERLRVRELPFSALCFGGRAKRRRRLPESLCLQRRRDRARDWRRDRCRRPGDHRRGLSWPRGRAGARRGAGLRRQRSPLHHSTGPGAREGSLSISRDGA